MSEQQSESAPGGSAGAHGSAMPTASDLRTAARVIRYICSASDKMQDEMPMLERLWWKITRESNDKLMRKSAVIERMADRLESPNDQAQRRAPGEKVEREGGER